MNFKNKTFIIFTSIFLTLGCSGNSETNLQNSVGTTNTNLESTTISDDLKAIALVSSGCAGGFIGTINIDDAFFLYPKLWSGIVAKYYVQNQGIDIYDTEAPEEQAARNSIFQLDIWQSEFIEKTFVSAKTLDSKWNDLYDMWIKSKSLAISEFENGKTIGQASSAAYDFYYPSMEPICKIAISKANTYAQSDNLTIGNWILKVAGELLPPDFENF